MTFTASKPKMLETHRGIAWTTVISYNGVKVADVENRGDGGCDHHEWHDRSKIDLFVAEVDKYIEDNAVKHPGETVSIFPPKDHRGQPEADRSAAYVERLMHLAEVDAQIVRMCKKQICLIMPGRTRETYSRVNLPPTPANIARVQADYPDAVILNKVSK